jgi:glucokinase
VIDSAARGSVALGIDVGGTKTCAAVVDPAGRVLRTTTAPTPARAGAAAILRTAADLATELLRWADSQGIEVVGCGAGVAGTVDARGVISHATAALPGWAGTDVAGGLSEALDRTVTVVNDVHAMALGEHRFGAAADTGSALIVAVGTGIGGAIVSGGALVIGRTGTAGALGHVPVPAAEPRTCPCGRIGHVEAYASGPAIVADYVARGGVADRLQQVAAAARAGDRLARGVISAAGEVLGTVLGGLSNVLDPDVVVIGGGVANLGDMFFDPLESALRRHALVGPDRVRIRRAALGDLAAVVGAASLALAPAEAGRPEA